MVAVGDVRIELADCSFHHNSRNLQWSQHYGLGLENFFALIDIVLFLFGSNLSMSFLW